MTPDSAAALSTLCHPENPWTAQDIRALDASKTGRFLTHSNGFLLAHVIPPEAEVLLIAVAPQARRQGIALGLLETLAREARTVFLDVAADNSPALALYARFGFERSGIRTQYYARKNGDPVDAVQMTWSKPVPATKASPRIG